MRISTAVSDLFFMVDNNKYFDEELSDEAREEVLRENAESFAELVNDIVGNDTSDPEGVITADMVIEDFKARL